MKTINYGIIGCGLIADFHARAVLELEETKPVKLYGVVDVRKEAAEKFGEKYSIKVYDTIDDMLADPEIHAVSICTPSGFHSDLAVKAASHGKHIVVEKPMAITKEQLEAVVKTCDENNVKLSSVAQMRFADNIVRAREAVQSGKLGRMVCGDCYMKYYRSPEYYAQGGWRGTIKLDGGGALMNQGIHGVDILEFIMGPVKSVYALTKTLARNIEVEDTAVCALEYESGAIGVIQATTSIYPGYPKRVELHGDKGTIKLEEDAILEWNIEGEETPSDIVIGAAQLNSSASRPDSLDTTGHRLNIGDLIDSIVEDRMPKIDQHEGKKPVDLILAIYESNKTGKPVDMKEFRNRK
ncbi:MAG: Gfo/Idh/MocA family oxidoreductase [Ruminococcaceae bacterium]|nr:Gfo/Idh/MocA family oxidoreductase [Oscillospiraceae bacterium]